MAGIREELTLVNNFSGTFNQFNTAANASIATAEAFKQALDSFSEGFVNGFTEELQRTSAELDEAANGAHRAAQGAEDAAQAQSKVTQETKATADAASGWLNQIKSVVAALGLAKLSKEFIESADNAMLLAKRAENVGLSYQELFGAAQRSRVELKDLAALATGVKRNASKLFGDPKEAVLFAENMSKAFKVAGADQNGIASATLQLNQALASGVLRGEEFNAVNENAHNIIELIAEEMNEPVEKMKDLAGEGKITADIIKNAVLGATEDINDEFAKLPMTFGDITTLFGNYLDNALMGKYIEWNDFLNSDEGQRLIADIANALVFLAEFGASAFMTVANAVEFVHSHLEDFIPLFSFLAAAAVAYAGVQIAAALSAAAAWATAHAPIIIILGLIASAISIAHYFGVTFAQVGQAVGQVVGIVYAVIYNAIMAVWNAASWVMNNFSAVMHNTGYDVVNVINSIGQAALDMVWTVADAIDSVFGSNLSGAVDSLKGNLQGWADSFGGRMAYTDFVSHDYINVKDTKDQFGSVGAMLGSKLDNIGGTLGNIFGAVDGVGDYSNIMTDGNGKVGEVGSVGKIDNDVTLSDEDLQIYRDLAEQRYMNRVELKTLAPNINVSIPDGTNLQPEDVANAIKGMLIEQMAANAATAH